MSYENIKYACRGLNRAVKAGEPLADIWSWYLFAIDHGASSHDISYNLAPDAIKIINEHIRRVNKKQSR